MERPDYAAGARMHRSKDPGAGGYSYFHNLRFRTNQDIPAGMELFVEYGDDWFVERESSIDSSGSAPLSEDFENADLILSKYHALFGTDTNSKFDHVIDPKHNKLPLLDISVKRDLLDFIRQDLVTSKRLQLALPSYDDLIFTQNKTISMSAAMHSVPNVTRTTNWLVENGRCLDNIYPAESTVYQAGRGAFASRSLKKNEVIAPAPLMHIQKSDMLMFTTDLHDDGKQLLINYCYGHPDSDLLFFPYSPITNFINHHHDQGNINAKIQWSSLSNHETEWMNDSAETVLNQVRAGLIMEFVATRDVKEGEEIFIDYGKRWQHAWDKHVTEWKASEKASSYMSPEWLNDDNTPVRTEREQINKPYFENVQIVCYGLRDFMSEEDGPNEYDYEDNADDVKDATKLKRYSEDALPCRILERDILSDGNNVYTAELRTGGEIAVLYNIPRYAIEFVDHSYMSDQYLLDAFRHEIGIPDDIFPDSWKHSG